MARAGPDWHGSEQHEQEEDEEELPPLGRYRDRPAGHPPPSHPLPLPLPRSHRHLEDSSSDGDCSRGREERRQIGGRNSIHSIPPSHKPVPGALVVVALLVVVVDLLSDWSAAVCRCRCCCWWDGCPAGLGWCCRWSSSRASSLRCLPAAAGRDLTSAPRCSAEVGPGAAAGAMEGEEGVAVEVSVSVSGWVLAMGKEEEQEPSKRMAWSADSPWQYSSRETATKLVSPRRCCYSRRFVSDRSRKGLVTRREACGCLAPSAIRRYSSSSSIVVVEGFVNSTRIPETSCCQQ